MSSGNTSSMGSDLLSVIFVVQLIDTKHAEAQRGLMQQKKKPGEIALRIGIAGAIAFGALASGFLISRRGRRFVRDVWHERRRTPLEDRVIDTIWGEAVLGRRPVDVEEIEPGVISVYGQVKSVEERRALLEIVEETKGVDEVEDHLEVVKSRRRFRE